jgi:HNH/ENDO VII superfamily nuclease
LGEYDQEILDLQTTPDGRYYVDPDDADGSRYPVNGKYHLGYVRGQEWWRIRDRAIFERWTRDQLRKNCSNPKVYQIEDVPGNLSHRNKLERSAGGQIGDTQNGAVEMSMAVVHDLCVSAGAPETLWQQAVTQFFGPASRGNTSWRSMPVNQGRV